MKPVFFTILTPTYNRCHTLKRVYDSLLLQTYKHFEWVIIDDGSSDNTSQFIEKLSRRSQFTIRYFFQKNGGKHRALNNGFQKAKGELILVFDSDDWCVPQTLERFASRWENIEAGKKDKCSGISVLKIYQNGTVVGDEYPEAEKINSYVDRFNMQIKGDKWELIRRDLCIDYPYPEIEGEKYIAPSYQWLQIGQKFGTIFCNEKLSIVEYLQDGISKNNISYRANNPKGCCLVYMEQFYLAENCLLKLKCAINYYRFVYHGGPMDRIGKYTLIGMMLGLFFFIADSCRCRYLKNRAKYF